MYLACRTQMFWDKYSIPECIRRGRKLGFEGLEICLENKNFDVMQNMLEDSMIKEITAECRTQAFRKISVSCHSDFVHNDTVFCFLKRAIPKIRDFGSEVFVLGGVFKAHGCREDPGWEEESKIYQERIYQLSQIAEKFDVKLAPEPEINCILRTTQDYIDLADAVSSPALCINFDVGHAFLTDDDPIAMIRKLGKRIVHVHFDNMLKGWHNHQLLTQGDMDLAQYLSAFRSIGYDGIIALDLYKHDIEKVAAVCLDEFNRLIELI